jgi:DNA polymerase I
LRLKEPDHSELKQLFDELEFRTTASRILSNTEAKPNAGVPFQASLFGEQEAMAPEKGDSNLLRLENVEHDYHLVASREERQRLISLLAGQKEFCFDTETDSLNPHNAGLVGIAFCFKAHEAYYVSIPENREEAQAVVEEFRGVLENDQIGKIGQNIKYDILVMSGYGVHVKGKIFDTMLAHYLLQPEQRHNLNFLSEVYLNYTPVPIEDLIGAKGRNQLTMRSVDIEKIKEYASEDADITWQLKDILVKEIEKENLSELASDLEMPLASVLASMEAAGVRLNAEALRSISAELVMDIAGLEKEIFKMAGMEFNIGSPKQMGEVLFKRMKIIDNAKRTKTKQFSTGEEVLDKLRDKHPVIGLILEHRGLKKLLSTYVDALPKLINPRTGRIHTSFNQAVTSTGRLSSTNPNLQNIPIREARGREIRKAFIPRDDEHIILAADYSQIELRLMAHMSGDSGMIEAFRNNEDIHSSTASKIFQVGAHDLTREMRARAKTANFGIIYGISAFGLSQRLSIPREEARLLIEGYFRSYPGVKQYMDNCIMEARDKGYVATIMGRKRFSSGYKLTQRDGKGQCRKECY